MGIDRHHAIIVTAGSRAWIEKAHTEAVRIFCSPDDSLEAWPEHVSPVIMAPANSWWTFLVGPDGGKEGRDVSKRGDVLRAQFIVWLKAQVDEDRYSPLTWVVVQYGDEVNLETIIVDDSEAEEREAEAE